MENLPIDPTKPVSGNLTGTLSGAAATLVSGWLLKSGIVTTCASYMCSGPDNCASVENALFLVILAAVGGGVNYAVTHVAQVKNLADLYAMLPSVYPDYSATTKGAKPSSSQNNFNK